MLVALGVDRDVVQAALDAYLAFEDTEGGARCSLAAEVVLPARKVRTAFAGTDGEAIAKQVLLHWEFFSCNQRLWGQREREWEHCPRDQLDSLGQWNRDRQKARSRQSSIDTAQTLRLATVEALLDAQSGV